LVDVARRKKGAEVAPKEDPIEETPTVEADPTEDSDSEERTEISEEEMFRTGRSWYVIHTYSGYEDKARTNLEQRIRSMDAEDLIFHVVVPSVDEIEIRDGARRTVPRKIFPGYVLVQMIEMRQEDPTAPDQEIGRSSKAWTVVRNTPGVTGFVGFGATPTPLDEPEVRSILRKMRAEEPRIKVGFQLGQSIRITDGPFLDFVGTVDEINVEKGKVRVLVSFFGRETPVELDFLQVEKL
jgi:transcriptional antiterminator NusG